jgi:hypothetical protein
MRTACVAATLVAIALSASVASAANPRVVTGQNAPPAKVPAPSGLAALALLGIVMR